MSEREPGSMTTREAISHQARKEREHLERSGQKAPTQEQAERTYRDAVTRNDRRKEK